jgi:hypothetical protein
MLCTLYSTSSCDALDALHFSLYKKDRPFLFLYFLKKMHLFRFSLAILSLVTAAPTTTPGGTYDLYSKACVASLAKDFPAPLQYLAKMHPYISLGVSSLACPDDVSG